MHTTEAADLARNLMSRHGLTQQGWTFGWSQAKRQFGRCEYRTKRIVLSKPATALNTEDEVRDTILHEIAHALTPGAGHGYEWKVMARRIGARPNRTTDQGIPAPSPWLLACPVCDFTVPRYRKTDTSVSCSKCDPVRYNPRFAMHWVDARAAA